MTSVPSQVRQGLVTVQASGSFQATIERLLVALKRRGLTIYTHIDHAKEAAAVDMILRPTHLFVVGYPEADSPLLARRQSLGLDIPPRILVWENEEGSVYLTYTDPVWLASHHGCSDMTSELSAIGVSLAGIAEDTK